MQFSTGCKGKPIYPKTIIPRRYFVFFKKKLRLLFAVKKKAVPLQTQSSYNDMQTMGYGVMVTLQILVLSFLVRVRVSQHQDILSV